MIATTIRSMKAGMRSSVVIPTDSVVLEGELELPHGAAGVVVFAHGSGSGRHSPRNQYVARMLREAGLGTLLLDLLTSEEEQQDNVTGLFRFDMEMLTKRLVDVTHWLEQQPGTQELKVGYFGSSTGGGVALMAAAELGDKVAAAVSRGGRPDLAHDALGKVKCPTLLIVGGYDEEVIGLNDQAYGLLHCPKDFRIIPAASHLFEEPGKLEQVAELSARWFAEYLKIGARKKKHEEKYHL